MANRRVILILCDYYSPGYRAGGVPRAVENLIDHLGGEMEFRVVTRNHDLGSEASYPGIPIAEWTRVGKAWVMYLSPSRLGFRAIRDALAATPHDLLYLHSCFSLPFGIRPLVMRRLGLLPRRATLMAPHGELSPGAVNIKGARKRLYLRAARIAGLFHKMQWHASTSIEAEYIRGIAGTSIAVHVARDLPTPTKPADERTETRRKARGALSAVFLSRVSRKKNLAWLVDAMNTMSGSVELHVYGPHDDPDYWRECERSIGALPTNVSVIDHGPIPPHEVSAALTRHHLFVLASRDENFGYVVLEALGAGCPVLISDQTPWRDLESKGVGWDLPLDASRFRAALQTCVDMDDAEFASLSRRAAEYAATFADDQAVVEQSRAMLASSPGAAP